MKRFSQLLTLLFVLAGLSACQSASEDSPDARYWKKIGREARLAARPVRQLHRLGPDAMTGGDLDGFDVADGRGLRHRRGDGDQRGLRDGRRGLRDGMGPGRGDGRRGMHRRGDGDHRGLRDGDRRDGMKRGEGRRKGPPAEALTACENKAAGDACSFVIEGETVTSVCKTRRNGDGPLACRAGRGTHRRHTTPAQ